MKRQFDPAEPELMDRPQPVSAELESDLHNLRQLNRYFGSYALVRRFLRNWIIGGQSVRVVDLATGSGDIPRLIANHAAAVGANALIDAVDQQASTITIAQKLSAHYPTIQFHKADVFEFGEAGSYDIVFCSLALHHFTEEDAIRLLRHCRQLARRYVLVSDLRRGLFTTVGVHLLTAFVFRDPMTRYDGRVSAARAFSFRELHTLAQRADWKNFHHRRFRYARQAIWMEKEHVCPG